MEKQLRLEQSYNRCDPFPSLELTKLLSTRTVDHGTSRNNEFKRYLVKAVLNCQAQG